MAEYQPRTTENTNESQPTRRFRFILDPSAVEDLNAPFIEKVDQLFTSMKLVNARVKIGVYVPWQLIADRYFIDHPLYSEWAQATPPEWKAKPFKLNSGIKRMIRRYVLPPGEVAEALKLLGASEYCQADGIVTKNKMLLEYRYLIYQEHRQRVVPLDEFSDIIEIVLHGHSIFLSAVDSWLRYYSDVFYQMCHWKASRYFRWFQGIAEKIKSEEYFEDLHSALLNRYPYIVYSRDMVRFYELQQDYFYRSGMRQSYGLTLGYYLNYFYLLLWGMMDHLTLIAKTKLKVSLDGRQCSMSNRKYWRAMRGCLPGLYAFVRSPAMNEWLEVMAEIRHHAAHKLIKRPSILLNAKSKIQPDDEIRTEIRNANKDLYNKFPEQMKALENVELINRKMDQYEILAPRMISITLPGGRTVLRDFVLSIDYDLERLNAVIDAFLIALFNSDN